MRINQPTDPIIRKRVRITGNSFITKWFSMLSIIAIIGGGVYVSSGIVESLMFNSEHEDSLDTEHMTISDKFVKVSMNSIQEVNTTDISDALLKGYSSSIQTELTPVAMKLPVKPQIPPIVKSENTQVVNTNSKLLLEKAKKQIAMKRLTSPKGDNAYETYQTITDTQIAKEVLNEIVAWYFAQGEKFISKNRIITMSNERSSAYKTYQKLLEIAPEHQNTKALFSNIVTELDKLAKQQLRNNKSINGAYNTYQKLIKVAPDSHKTKQLLTKITNQLFTKAKNQIIKQQYSTPKNDNAATTFKQILEISPDNTKAKRELKKIVKRYYKLALRRYNQGRYKGSMTWLKRGLNVSNNDTDLNQLKQKVIEKLK
ncbi:hypothetical protein QUF74_15860 [Candidatus Halobeggiatoa sp. HSG11]|nr:hypothetical protein [Candidatus Halobeggiatoa sp. HSG11]